MNVDGSKSYSQSSKGIKIYLQQVSQSKKEPVVKPKQKKSTPGIDQRETDSTTDTNFTTETKGMKGGVYSCWIILPTQGLDCKTSPKDINNPQKE